MAELVPGNILLSPERCTTAEKYEGTWKILPYKNIEGKNEKEGIISTIVRSYCRVRLLWLFRTFYIHQSRTDTCIHCATNADGKTNFVFLLNTVSMRALENESIHLIMQKSLHKKCTLWSYLHSFLTFPVSLKKIKLNYNLESEQMFRLEREGGIIHRLVSLVLHHFVANFKNRDKAFVLTLCIC